MWALSVGSNFALIDWKVYDLHRAIVAPNVEWGQRHEEVNHSWPPTWFVKVIIPKMIEFSIRLHPHPEEIGPPVDVLQIMPKTGIHWVQGEARCAAQ
jgi:hypothetical protein